MEKFNTVEDKIRAYNGLIANFMGLGVQFHMAEHPETGEYTDLYDLQYSHSLDWLNPVLEKVREVSDELPEAEEFWKNEAEIDIRIFWAPTNVLYNGIVEFIEWYNKLKGIEYKFSY